MPGFADFAGFAGVLENRQIFRPKLHLICSLYLPILCHVSHTVSLGYLPYLVFDGFDIFLTALCQLSVGFLA